MKRNHWHTAGSKKRQAAYKYGYKSGLELTVAEQIKSNAYEVCYETETLHYTVPESKHKYTQDFVFTKKNGELMYIETKGRWIAVNRKKMQNLIKSNQAIKIRMFICCFTGF